MGEHPNNSDWLGRGVGPQPDMGAMCRHFSVSMGRDPIGPMISVDPGGHAKAVQGARNVLWLISTTSLALSQALWQQDSRALAAEMCRVIFLDLDCWETQAP